MIINQASLRGLTTSYSAAFQKALDEAPTDYKELATVVPSSTAEQAYAWLGQMPGLREWIGEREIQSIKQHGYTIKNKTFERTIGVPREAIEDDQYGVYAPFMAAIGSEAGRHPNDLIYAAMMAGFTELCYDGKAFFAEDHKVGDKTYSNKGKDALSQHAFATARAAIMSILGDKGKSLHLVPDVLVVSPAKEMEGRKILEADLIEGTSNITKGLARLKVAPELAEKPDYWFLLCTNRPLKPFIYQERKKIKFVSKTDERDDNVFMRNEYLYGADGRSNAGYGFWQMAYGSTGETHG